MKGLMFLGDRRAELREWDIPEPGPGQVLVRVMATGICGSDLHVYRDAPDQAPGQIGGHEPSGAIERVGSAVVRRQVGERVAVHHHVGCGACPACAEGDFVACPDDRVVGVHCVGSFAPFMVVPERSCVPMPEPLSFVDGVFMACVGTTAYGALRRIAATPHETLAVYGLGPVGLSAVLLGKAMGMRVAGVDVLPERIEAGRRCGADLLVRADESDPVRAIHDWSRGVGTGRRSGADCLIETSGATAARRALLPSLCRGGRAAILGVGGVENVINPTDIHGKAATIVGSVVFPVRWMWDLAEFLVRAGVSFEPAVTHRFPLDQAEQAVELADRGSCGKVLILPQQ